MLDFIGASAVVLWDHMAKDDGGEVDCVSSRCSADEDCRCTCAVDVDALDDTTFYQDTSINDILGWLHDTYQHEEFIREVCGHRTPSSRGTIAP